MLNGSVGTGDHRCVREIRNRLTLVVLIVAIPASLAMLGGCEDLVTNPTGSVLPGAVSMESKEVSLYLSGELTPPGPLSRQIHEELAQLRATYGGEYPIVNALRFRSKFALSCVIVGLTPEAVEQYRHGEYHAWDELNERYHLTEIDTTLFVLGAAVLQFQPLLHPRRLAEAYQVLPGVRYAEPNAYVGDWPNIYPRLAEGGTTYLVRNAWGDCPSGCMYNEYWYFAFENGEPRFIGHWDPLHDPTPPPWWLEALQNMQNYFSA